MNGIGSYHASVYGVGKAFSNQVYSDYIRTTYSVAMKGYNYDELYGYANALKDRLINSGKGRIKEVYLLGGSNRRIYVWQARKNPTGTVWRWINITSPKAVRMLHLHYGEARRYSRGSSPFQTAYINGIMTPVSVKSLQSDKYDYWSFVNAPLRTSIRDFGKDEGFLNC